MPKIILNDGQVLFDEVLNGSDTIDPASVDAAGTATSTITVEGATVGSYVLVAPPYDLQGLVCSGYVSADDTVTIVLFNPAAAAVDLPSGEWKVKVLT